MKTTQKPTVREDNLGRLPKFAIPPELLILREIESLETSERLGPMPYRNSGIDLANGVLDRSVAVGVFAQP